MSGGIDLSKDVPIWESLGKLSSKKLEDKIGKHREILGRFETETKYTIDRLEVLRRDISRHEKRIVKSLDSERTPEAIADIFKLRKLKIDEMVELSALAVLRSNRFYNKLVLDVSRGIKSNIRYDEESIKAMVPDQLEDVISTAVESSDFYDILSKYRGMLKEYVSEEGGES